MHNVSFRLAGFGLIAALLCAGSPAMAVGAPKVSDQGWHALESFYNEAVSSASSQGAWMHQAVAIIYAKHHVVSEQRRPDGKRAQDAKLWARSVVRGKLNGQRRMAAAIDAEQRRVVSATPGVTSGKVVNRERLVRIASSKVPTKCSQLHTHERAMCIYDALLSKRNVPALVAAGLVKEPVHAAAHK